jgi:hypothetical protein
MQPVLASRDAARDEPGALEDREMLRDLRRGICQRRRERPNRLVAELAQPCEQAPAVLSRGPKQSPRADLNSRDAETNLLFVTVLVLEWQTRRTSGQRCLKGVKCPPDSLHQRRLWKRGSLVWNRT